jgi:hypothetical protein
MTLPFTIEEFLQVFQDYNAAIWPAQIFAEAIGIVILAALFVRRDGSLSVAMAALGVLWAFTGIGYHLMFFARINPLAPVFAGFFVVQAFLFVLAAIRPGNLRLSAAPTLRWVLGLAAIVYAMAVYPVMGIWAGHGGMAGPMFGVAPCPTTIFTLGILMMTRGRWVVLLSIIPVLWSLIGLAAALQLGIPEDLGLPVAGAVLIAVLAATALQELSARGSVP